MNEELKIVAIYDGGLYYQTDRNDISTLAWQFSGQPFEVDQSINIYDEDLQYHASYDWQIPVWQKAWKEIESHNFEYMSTEWQRFGELWTLYHDAIDKAAPLESFEILVQAIQFINKMEK